MEQSHREALFQKIWGETLKANRKTIVRDIVYTGSIAKSFAVKVNNGCNKPSEELVWME